MKLQKNPIFIRLQYLDIQYYHVLKYAYVVVSLINKSVVSRFKYAQKTRQIRL